MPTNVSGEARQRNGVAVQRLFHRESNQRSRTAVTAHVHSSPNHTTATNPYGDAAGSSTRMAATSAAALVGGGGCGKGQATWTQPDGRGFLRQPALDAPSHLGRQLELSSGMRILTREEHTALLSRASPVQQPTSALRLDEISGADRSCFVLAVQRAQHARAVQSPNPAAALTPYEASKEHWAAYHHQQAVLRHEQTLPRRRAVDPYVHLTGAQVDAGLTVPNTYTADVLAARSGGLWVLDNPHRQQYYRGEPVMTSVMRGDFYGEGAAQRAAGRPRHDVQAKNRRDVHVTSEVNRAERRRQHRATHTCACKE